MRQFLNNLLFRPQTTQTTIVKCALFGTVASIILGMMNAYIMYITDYRLSILYIGIGLAIAYVITSVSESNATIYCILSAVFAALAVLVGEVAVIILLLNSELLFDMSFWRIAYNIFVNQLQDMENIKSSIFYIIGIVFAFMYAKGYDK